MAIIAIVRVRFLIIIFFCRFKIQYFVQDIFQCENRVVIPILYRVYIYCAYIFYIF